MEVANLGGAKAYCTGWAYSIGGRLFVLQGELEMMGEGLPRLLRPDGGWYTLYEVRRPLFLQRLQRGGR